MGKEMFVKRFERDTSLAMQALWARSFAEDISQLLGVSPRHVPMHIHFADSNNTQIWENEAATQWIMDALLPKNADSADFIDSLSERYTRLLQLLEPAWDNEVDARAKRLGEIFTVTREALMYITLVFYIGLDSRTPQNIIEKAVQIRERDTLFARSDEFVRSVVKKRIGKERYAYLVMPEELTGEHPEEIKLSSRAAGCVLVEGRDLHVMSLVRFAAEHAQYEFKDMKTVVATTRNVFGSAAYRGIAKGEVRIVRNREDARRVQTGDVMIAPMTTPDFIDAMQKAVAFVTDEGGVTCHAAIVAREMRKPCVIGTKIATQVFKDGDMVEVDAERGVVRKT